MKRVIGIGLALALVAAFLGPNSLGKEPAKKSLMQKKLAHSQKILEGLALENFKTISTHAEELIAISKAAEWKGIKSPRYEVYSGEFRRLAASLMRVAKQKNLDGATLAYLELTLTCVKCHKHVREIRTD